MSELYESFLENEMLFVIADPGSALWHHSVKSDIRSFAVENVYML
jgi:hypothetical protein